MLKLHYFPDTISIAPAIVLAELGTPYTPVLVDFTTAAQRSDRYRRVNPKGRVPALETPQGVLTETGAILEYLAPQMIPADAFAAARMRELMFYLSGTMHVNHAHKLRGARWADDPASWADMKRKIPQTMAESCAYLDALLPQLPFWGAQDMVLSDAYLYVVLSWGPGDGVDLDDFPNLQAFRARMKERPSVQTIHAKGLLT